MEFHIQREPFLKLLNRIQSVVERRNTMPILGNALLEVTADNRVLLSATDLEVSLRTNGEAEVITPGAMAVGARKLHDVVRELPEAPLHLRSETGERLLLTCGRARFNLACLPAAEFPALPDADGSVRLNYDSATLGDMFGKTAFAMSQDETRFTLNGVLLQLEPGQEEGERAMLRLVATDTHRLALVENPASERTAEARELIIPRKAVLETKKLLDEVNAPVDVVLGESHIQFAREDLVLISKLVDARFPNFRRVIPERNERLLTVDREGLLAAVRRMAVLSNEKSRGIRLEITQGQVTITTTNPEQEAAEEELAATYTDPDVTIGFNARYLQEILTALEGDSVRLALRNEESPVLVTDPDQDNLLYVLMPMRV